MIGRVLMYVVIVVLGIFVLTATFLVDSGGDSTATIGEITVADLLLTPEKYEDREISTRGLLTVDEESEQFFVGGDQLQIRITFEPGGIDEFIDQDVRVIGRLDFDSEGVFIDADLVRPTDVN
ncbi:MAG: hypothetical protein IH957_02260 [Chloroflexi bacterium]|nr:hypothetical protein [Chloroflexota bacterium]